MYGDVPDETMVLRGEKLIDALKHTAQMVRVLGHDHRTRGGLSPAEAIRLADSVEFEGSGGNGYGVRTIWPTGTQEFSLNPPKKPRHPFTDADRLPVVSASSLRSSMAARASRSAAERKESESGMIGSHAVSEWSALLDRFDNRCVRCGINAHDATGGRLTRDHVVPVSEGGTDYIGNIQPLCAPCNSWKGDREIDFRNNPMAKADGAVALAVQ